MDIYKHLYKTWPKPNTVRNINDQVNLILLHLPQLHLILRIDSHHKIASSPRLKCSRNDHVAARGKFKPPENLSIVDVRTRSPAVIGVHEMVGPKAGRWISCTVDTKPYLKHLDLEEKVLFFL